MSTTRKELSDWFDRGIAQGATHMVVVCDTFSYEDYPVFCKSEAAARAVAASPGEMQRIMEVYNLTKDKDTQVNTSSRVWNL